MATPIPTQILNEIETRLANIKTANGYFNTLKRVDRARVEPWVAGDLPACNVFDTGERRIDEGGTYQGKELTVIIELHDKTRDEPFTDLASRLAADVQIAMNRSSGNPLVADVPSMAFGGLVSRVAVNNYSPIIGSGQKPYCGALLEFSITYRVKPDDPFTIFS